MNDRNRDSREEEMSLIERRLADIEEEKRRLTTRLDQLRREMVSSAPAQFRSMLDSEASSMLIKRRRSKDWFSMTSESSWRPRHSARQ